MQLTESAIEQFKQRYQEHCGQEVTFEQAAVYARDALELLQLIYRPIKKQDLEAAQEEAAALKARHYGNCN